MIITSIKIVVGLARPNKGKKTFSPHASKDNLSGFVCQEKVLQGTVFIFRSLLPLP
jgi:hypothetical protein